MIPLPAPFDGDAEWERVSFGRTLAARAQSTPTKLALVGEGQRLTFADVDRRVDELAHGLRSAGVRRGDWH